MDVLATCHRYADQIISGEIVSGKLMILAAERFKNDLNEGKFEFLPGKAEEFIKYAQHFKHWQGPMGGKKLKLEPHQVFYFANLFGWYRSDGTRRFRNVYKQVARKNGKTTESGLLGLYMVEKAGDYGPQVIVAANREEQAGICVNTCGRMLEQIDAAFMGRNYTKEQIEQYPWRNYEYLGRVFKITHQPSNGMIMAIGKDAGRSDGFNPSAGILDEYHEARDDSLLNVLRSGMGARKGGGLVNIITTAGFNKGGVCYRLRDYTTKILQGLIEGDSWLPLVYELDEDMDWHDPDFWVAANPNLGVSVDRQWLIDEHDIARDQGGSAEVGFRTKNLNQWTDSEDVWIQDEYIKACDQYPISLQDLQGREVWAGIDLAKTRDINALALISPNPRKQTLDVLWRFYVPEETLDIKEHSVDLSQWANKELQLTPGNIMDHNYIVNDVKEILEMGIDIRAIGYDKYLAESHNTVHGILQLGYQELRPVTQTPAILSTPTKECEIRIMKRGLNFDNSLARWMFSNVVLGRDSNGNIKADKAKSGNKIDGISALVNAMKVYQEDQAAPQIVVDNQVYGF